MTPAASKFRPSGFGEATLRRDSPFRYTCNACNRCCHNYRIQVNPYEVLTLARHLRMRTTVFMHRHLADGPYLKRRADGSCGFLGANGCGVHPARPLVCRLYPLGRHISSTDDELFSHIRPHPETAGDYGLDGTIGDYLAAQGALPYIEAADRYMALFRRLHAVLRQASAASAENMMNIISTGRSGKGPATRRYKHILDPDKAIDLYFGKRTTQAHRNPQDAMGLHIKAILRCLHSHSKGKLK
jgi:Fe-S-cluster containining protein